MNPFSRMLSALRSYWQGPWQSRDPLLGPPLWGPPASSGIFISESTALNYSAVWAAVQLIAGAVASLPLILYRRLPDGGKERFVTHPTYRVLHDHFNPEMSSMVARETMMSHVLLWGNAYAEIQRDAGRRPMALWPLPPHRVRPFRDPRTRELRYEVTSDIGARTILFPDEILHVPGLGFDGIVGYSIVAKAREAIGLGLATERFGSNFFGAGSQAGGVVEHPGRLSQEAAKRIKESIEAEHQGLTKAHRVMVLEEGMHWKRTTFPPDDAQFLETRKFQVVEVARWFNLPPHKLRDLERATFSNIEQQQIDFVTDTLRPWLIRFEQELNFKLIAPLESRIQFVEHLVDALLRGDTESRYRAYFTGRQGGWLSVNEIRARENLNPVPGGDELLKPLNMTPLSSPATEPTRTALLAWGEEIEAGRNGGTR